ncbi:oxytocin receptor-like [Saccostrea cucullata]|uniref:oxytocin receptor-like n=1 Tax=Saccostrea cuccullata TaxID=36930 RepID=UPI002ED5AD12
MDNSSVGTEEIAIDLESFNDAYIQRSLPNTIVILFFLFVGVLGNSLILYVYEFRFPRSDGRYYIGALAFCDLGAIIFTSVLNLLQNLTKYVFPGDIVCKGVLYLSYSFINTSLFLWNVIAVQRFRKICRPFSWQLKHHWRRWCIVICVGVSFTLYSPVLYFYSINEEVFTNNNITVFVCQQIKTHTFGLKIFQGIGFILSIANVIAIISIYVIVSIKIFKVMRGVRRARTESIRSVTITCPTTTSSLIEGRSADTTADPVPTRRTISESQTAAQKLEHTIAFTFMTILLMGLLSYAPSRYLLVYETLDPTFWDSLDYTKFNFYLFLRRLYVINHSCNVFIYLIFDSMFRKEVRNLIGRSSS